MDQSTFLRDVEPASDNGKARLDRPSPARQVDLERFQTLSRSVGDLLFLYAEVEKACDAFRPGEFEAADAVKRIVKRTSQQRLQTLSYRVAETADLLRRHDLFSERR